MTRQEHLAKAIKEVLDAENLSIEIFDNQLPRKFWQKVSDRLPDGLGWKTDKASLSNYFGNNKTSILPILNSDFMAFVDEPSHYDTAQQSLYLSDTVENTPKTQIQTISISTDELHQMIDKVVSDKLSAIKSSVQNDTDNIELVPKPKPKKGEGKGRRLDRQFDKVTITIDKNLNKLFNQEARRLRIEQSRLIDSILWNRYGKPALTYGDNYSTE